MNKFKVDIIEDYISRDKMPDAFKYLLRHVNNSSDYNSLKEELLIKRSLYTRIESDNRKGILDKDTYFRQRSIISHVLLSVSHEIYSLEKVEDEFGDNSLEHNALLNEIDKIKDRIRKIEDIITKIEEKFGFQLSEFLIDDSEKSLLDKSSEFNQQLKHTKQNLTIEDPRINFVLVFGKAGVGRTTLLASIFKYLLENYPIKYNAIGNKGGLKYLQQLLEALNQNNFPKTTGIGNIEEINLSISDSQSGFSTIITFLELAGEELIQTHPKDYKIRPKAINLDTFTDGNGYLKFLVVTTPLTAKEDDILIYTFINYLSKKYFDRQLNIGLIVNKWDLIEPRNFELSAFIKEKLPLTSNLLAKDDIKSRAFKFSAVETSYRDENISKIVKHLLEGFKTTPNNVQSAIASIRRLLRLH